MPLDPALRLESDRLVLRPIEKSAARSILRGIAPANLNFAEGYPSEFSLEVMDLLAGNRRSEAPGFAPWFMILKSENSVIGDLGSSWKQGDRSATVGYDVILPRQGQGFATEALKTLIGFYLSQTGVEMVTADTFSEHIASRRVMEKAGMTFTRTIRRIEDGEERDLVVYEIHRASGG